MATKAFVLALAVGAAGVLGASAARSEPEKPLHGAGTQAQVVEVLARAKDVKDVKLDQGSEHGVKERQVFEIFRETTAYALPLSGGSAKLRVNRELVGRAVVYSVQPRVSFARVFDDKGAKVEKLQTAILNQAIAAPALEPYVRTAKPDEKSPQATASWRQKVDLSLDVEVVPGRRAYYEWRSPAGGAFTKGVEVSPGVFRTVEPKNEWLAPFEKKTCPINVTIQDSATTKPTIYSIKLEASGRKQDDRAHAPKGGRTVFEKRKFEGIRDVAFDARSTLWLLDGTPGTLSGHEWLRGITIDGWEIPGAEVTKGNFAALAVNDDHFFFLDLKDTCVKRYGKGGTLAQVLGSEPLRIGESGSGNGRFKDPVDLGVLPDGGVVVLDAGQKCVHRFDEAGNFVYSFGHPGERDHDLKEPVAMAVAHDGTVYVLDNGRKRVVVYKNGRVDRDDIEVGIAADDLRGVAVDDFAGTVAVLERNAGVVKLFAPTRDGWSNTFKSSSMGGEDVAFMKKPSRLRMDATRVVHAIDRDGESLVRLDAAERADFIGRLGGVELSSEVSLAAGPESGVVALDRSEKFAVRFDRRGWATAKMGMDSQGEGALKTPLGVGVDAAGSIFAIDAKRCELHQYQGKGGAWLKLAGGSKQTLSDIMRGQISSQREKFIIPMRMDRQTVGVLDPHTGDLVKLELDGIEKVVAATFSGRFDMNAAGNNDEGTFWVIDKNGERVSRFTLRNKTPIELTQPFSKVTSLAANVGGAVFLCDREAKKILSFAANGSKFPWEESGFKDPSDIATDDLGRLFVFDSETKRIVELAD